MSLKPGDVVAPLGDGGIEGDSSLDVISSGDQEVFDVAESSTPSSIDSSHLRLWLSASDGITCAQGRVSRWADLSGHGNDAVLLNGQLGPRCQVTPIPHTVNGIDLPFFSAPTLADGGFNVIDETLDVNLGFLVGSDYTLFVVERRWSNTSASEAILGTTVPLSVELAGWAEWCNPNPINEALAVGYVYKNGQQFAVSQGCTDGILVDTAIVPTPPPIGLGEETITLDQTRGHEVWFNGTAVGSDSNTSSLTYAAGGAVGRADFVTTALGFDNRFYGDIAEVIVYDSSLSDADRSAVESYLRGRWMY